jgi:hypothetical protein
MTNEEIVEALVKNGVTCWSCWWQEGGRCYVEPCEREAPQPGQIGERSLRMATVVCHKHTSKRAVLSTVIPNDMLVISSEQNLQK